MEPQRRTLAAARFALAFAPTLLGVGAAEDARPAELAQPPARVELDPDAGAFTVVIVPDTQHEVDTDPDTSARLEFPWQLPRLERNAEWICENRDGLRIAAVLHVGDFVQAQPRGVHTQWDAASRLLDRLEGCGVPWLGAFGNHDCDAGPSGCAVPGGGDRAGNFQQYVMKRAAKQPEWQGAGPEIHPAHGRCGLGGAQRAPSRSGWIRFAKRFAALSLDWYPDCEAQTEWARSVLEQHRASTHFILLGHAIARPGESPACAASTEPGQALRAGQLASGGGVLAIVGGHYVTDPNFSCYGDSRIGASRVINVFSDFQTNLGERTAGTLVLLRIDAAAPRERPNVCVRQFNPSLGKFDVSEPERCFEVDALR